MRGAEAAARISPALAPKPLGKRRQWEGLHQEAKQGAAQVPVVLWSLWGVRFGVCGQVSVLYVLHACHVILCGRHVIVVWYVACVCCGMCSVCVLRGVVCLGDV